jgi:hypothetical protein
VVVMMMRMMMKRKKKKKKRREKKSFWRPVVKPLTLPPLPQFATGGAQVPSPGPHVLPGRQECESRGGMNKIGRMLRRSSSSSMDLFRVSHNTYNRHGR